MAEPNPFKGTAAPATKKQAPGDGAPPPPAARGGRSHRQCRIDCNYVAYAIRILAALTCLGVGVSAGWAMYQAVVIYGKNVSASQTFQLSSTNYAALLGLLGFYYCLFSVVTFLAEVRTGSLRRTVLKPFGFLQSWLGRGCLYIILGTVWVVLPIDLARLYISQATGGAWIGFGALEILVAMFLTKRTGSSGRSPGETLPAGSRVNWDGSVAPSAAAAYATTTETKLTFDDEKGSGGAGGGVIASSPAKARLMPSNSIVATPTDNPFRSAITGAAGGGGK